MTHTGTIRCCRECARAYERAYYAKNPEKKAESVQRWRARQEPETIRKYVRKYAQNNVEKERLRRRRFYQENLQKERERGREYRQRNSGKVKASKARRRASLIQATPPWVDLEAIRAIYDHCPPGHEVDHIVPLKGANVCGLHVPWNFQYLTKSENARKGNRF